jgi:hypothetical protein
MMVEFVWETGSNTTILFSLFRHAIRDNLPAFLADFFGQAADFHPFYAIANTFLSALASSNRRIPLQQHLLEDLHPVLLLLSSSKASCMPNPLARGV